MTIDSINEKCSYQIQDIDC